MGQKASRGWGTRKQSEFCYGCACSHRSLAKASRRNPACIPWIHISPPQICMQAFDASIQLAGMMGMEVNLTSGYLAPAVIPLMVYMVRPAGTALLCATLVAVNMGSPLSCMVFMVFQAGALAAYRLSFPVCPAKARAFPCNYRCLTQIVRAFKHRCRYKCISSPTTSTLRPT